MTATAPMAPNTRWPDSNITIIKANINRAVIL